MTHEEYVSQAASLSDSELDVAAVLAHVDRCFQCHAQRQLVERQLARLDPPRRSFAVEAAQLAAAIATVALIVAGLRASPKPASPKPEPPRARYRIVGDASGVVAYTPSGVIAGSATLRSPKEVQR